MKQLLVSLVSGLLFGAGLAISGMTQADKVIAFLDLTDNWDPGLAMVMVGATAVHFISYRVAACRNSPVFGARFGIPTRTDIDHRLVGGSALFGIGWALGGYCPGPGLVSSTSGSSQGLVFVAALTGGMLLFHIVDEALRGQRDDSAPKSKKHAVLERPPEVLTLEAAP